MPTTPPPDPVLARRARMGRLAEIGQRGGYALFALAIGVFFYGIVAGFTSTVAVVVVVALGAGSLVLAPAIVLGYAVKAAAREEREQSLRRAAGSSDRTDGVGHG
jgi:hypothetical protein